LSDKQREDRLQKLEQLTSKGIAPYGQRFRTTGSLKAITDSFSDECPGARVVAAGRIVANRPHGKAAFLNIRDWTGRIQVYVRKDRVGDEAFEVYGLLDLGDIIGAEGELLKTRTGEITIFVDKLTVLCKALRPLPEKYHGLKDVEIRQRRRYLDLIANEDTMKAFLSRTQMVSCIRRWLDERGFVEVETPMMHHIAGGAAARPFTTHHNSLDIDLFMRIAPELHLKRLVVGGMEKVYEINRNFRNEGISTRHNPEFTMIEVYEAYSDLEGMMELAEGLFAYAATEITGGTCVTYGDMEVELAAPWRRARYADLIRQYAGVDAADAEAVARKAASLGIDVADLTHEEAVDELFSGTVEPNLVQPTFVTHFPTAMCPLAKHDPKNPEVALRFELFIAGIEQGNAYSELNDPIEQLRRFEEQAGGHASKIDFDYVEALEYGLPPTGGFGFGIDRLAMVLLNRPSIRDVILFPLLRPEGKG
jgi:lysyl-tRNA synthetase class 2